MHPSTTRERDALDRVVKAMARRLYDGAETVTEEDLRCDGISQRDIARYRYQAQQQAPALAAKWRRDSQGKVVVLPGNGRRRHAG